jgi:hypothetical protein
MNFLRPLPFWNFKGKTSFSNPQPTFSPRSLNWKAPIIISVARPRCHDIKIYHGGFSSSIGGIEKEKGWENEKRNSIRFFKIIGEEEKGHRSHRSKITNSSQRTVLHCIRNRENEERDGEKDL